jgi:putative FmdB family regulatory protein
MPTYEYACSSCGHRFDVRQSFSDAPITDCLQCGATVRRVLYPAGVIFKGSGWYKTDSRPASHSEPATSTSSGETSTTSKAEPKVEPKSDPGSATTEPKKSEAVKPAADD